jgi:hypothetical protein
MLAVTGAALATTTLGTSVVSALSTETDTEPLPRLQVSGNQITTTAGDAVTLRGLNIVDPKRANTRAERGLTSTEMVDLLTDHEGGWYPTVVRIPVQAVDIGGHEYETAPEPPAFTQAELDDYLTTHLDPLIDRCAERGVYAIVDYHRHWPGVAWGDVDKGTINEPLQQEAVLFWETVAPRYAAADHVLYEIYNEPTEPGMWGPTDQQWVRDVWQLYLQFAQPIVDTVRSHTDTIVLVGSPGWSQSPEGALIEPITGGNIAYTYHIYPGHEASKQQAWDDSTINGEGVEGVYEQYPLFVTEFGWREYDDRWLGGTTTEFGAPFMEWLDANDSIHWTAWCGDIWWEPAMFEQGQQADDWLLRGRDTGSTEDSGEFIRQALARHHAVDSETTDTTDSETDDGTESDTIEEDSNTDTSTEDSDSGSEDDTTTKHGWEQGKGRGKGRNK